MHHRKFYLPLLLLLILYAEASPVYGGLPDYSRDDFPADFVFGSGVSAYQYEGAASKDGRTPSVWDAFAHDGGYADGANGDTACKGYYKFKEDVKLMAETGLEAFRFSISWSRLIPYGRGPVNPKGLEFYNHLINELIHHGIQPHVTLHHDDLPQALQDEYGGWLDRKSVKDFTAYANVCFKEFGDRVLHWTTFNEANVFVLGGYDLGFAPPGRCSRPFGVQCSRGGNSQTEPYIAAHNILLAHASAARLYSESYKATQHGFVGFNIFAYHFIPYTNASVDVIATQRANDFYIGWFLNPLTLGDYPDVMKENAGTRIPVFTKNESEQVKGSLDFIGLNHYAVLKIKDRSESLENDNRDFEADIAAQIKRALPNASVDEFPVMPSGLYGVLEYLKQVYGNLPIYVQENGQMTRQTNLINDTSRVEYLQAYIGSLLDAMRNGSNIRGYFTWSFMDLLELLDGYQSSYGLYYVDFQDENLTRYPKASARWYNNFLKSSSSKSSTS